MKICDLGKKFKKSAFFSMSILILCLGIGIPSSWSKSSSSGIDFLMQFENALVEIAEKVKPSVVNISPLVRKTKAPPMAKPRTPRQRPPDAPSSGSGVILDKDG